ncbi:MAG: hypothetical protein KC457_20490, partial [Myxococcales bacterium]|nr:hypothetical protein [Myxococcales bacterium]
DDPRVQAHLGDSRYTGPSLFEKLGQPFNPTRVLVRGWTGKADDGPTRSRHDNRRARALLADARPKLERCYEVALTRGAQIYARAGVDLRWQGGELVDASFSDADPTPFDLDSQVCLLTALRTSSAEDAAAASDEATVRLELSFFIQPTRWPSQGDQDYDYFGPSKRPSSGPINEGAVAEDVGREPPFRSR